MAYDNEEAKKQARAQLDSILEMVQALDAANEGDDWRARDEAEQAIRDDVLSIEVRSGWYVPGSRDKDDKPAEFRALLCTGGPEVRLWGTLDEYGEVENVHIQYRDWGTRFEGFLMTGKEGDAVKRYLSCFYFGE